MARRKEIDVAKLLNYWNDGLTIQEIADNFQCNGSVIRRVLKENDIDCSRSAMMKRHYNNRDFSWDDVKCDLDSGMQVQDVIAKYHTSSVYIHRLMYENDYLFCRKDMSLQSEDYKNRLIELRKTHTVQEIADMFGKSEKTISRHLKNFGLTKPADRTDIKDEDILNDWSNHMSIIEIARKYDCSHDTITKRLAKYDISCDRKSGIERHFERVHGQDWDAIKRELDNCVPVSIVAQRYNMRYEAVYRLMELNNYQYDGFTNVDMNKLDFRISQHLDDECYLNAIKEYYQEFGNAPVIYTLSRKLNLSIKEMREIAVKYDLFEFLGTEGPSVKVMRVTRDLTKLGIRYELNNRTILNDNGVFKEIDIYLPDYHIGIEINPTWTHSVDTLPYGQADKNYHQNKSLLAIQAGIGLIHLYDTDFMDEFRYQVFLQQMKSLICHKIRIGARKCVIRVISRKLCNIFLNKYHFQGGENASFIQYGMFYGSTLIGVFTLGKSRYTDDEFEIIRYCMNPFYIVYGCFDKFLHQVCLDIGRPCDIVSYMDLNKRLTASNVYERHNFVYEKTTVPDYVWIKQSGMDCKSRYSVTKAKLVAEGFDANMTEVEIMKSRFYCRVYGAGSKRYKYHFDC